MMQPQVKTMRDALIEQVYNGMCSDEDIFFVSADMGAPALDKIRRDFKDRFINVGIAEQNLILVSAGLALEGMKVYAFAIAPFISMRACEQIRVNLAMSSHHRSINVNLLAVGVGVSYDVSGPSHHCIEDISIIRTLPNITMLSPCDWVTAGKVVDYTLSVNRPKYIRLDGKPLPNIYQSDAEFDWERGFCELLAGDDICLVGTGYMTHRAMAAAKKMRQQGIRIGVLDIYNLTAQNEAMLLETLQKYCGIITLEEAFINRGGLDCLVSNIVRKGGLEIRLHSMGFSGGYIFKTGSRDDLAALSGFGMPDVITAIEKMNDNAYVNRLTDLGKR